MFCNKFGHVGGPSKGQWVGCCGLGAHPHASVYYCAGGNPQLTSGWCSSRFPKVTALQAFCALFRKNSRPRRPRWERKARFKPAGLFWVVLPSPWVNWCKSPLAFSHQRVHFEVERLFLNNLILMLFISLTWVQILWYFEGSQWLSKISLEMLSHSIIQDHLPMVAAQTFNPSTPGEEAGRSLS